MPLQTSERIAIVGGGIAGLFCAFVLIKNGFRNVTVFESTHRLGGRIRSLRLDKNYQELGDNTAMANLEFFAEFGPMRIELDQQLLLKALLDLLEFRQGEPLLQASIQQGACLIDFPSYASPGCPHEPQYELAEEEESLSPLGLLQLGLMRICIQLDRETFSDVLKKKFDTLQNDIGKCRAMAMPWQETFEKWLTDLKEQDIWEIQTTGRIGETELWKVGFWNIMSDFLSHNALLKMQDLGSFYHLIPENPNAAEWFVWWLRGFKIGETLQGIHGGMETIIARFSTLIDSTFGSTSWWLPNHSLQRITEHGEEAWNLHFETTPDGVTPADVAVDRIILALPKAPLEKIVRNSQKDPATNLFKREDGDVFRLLDSAFGFPMTKTFCIVKKRWWEEDQRANRYASHIPTRELHYWKGLQPNSKQGLIMAYSDRPASSYWANYVPPGVQADVNRTSDPEGPSWDQSERLRIKIAQYIKGADVAGFKPHDVVWFGIRDWGRHPFGAANHAWRPERKYWVVMRRLANLGGKNNFHFCGEAYSDYHGFMEGPLRSASYVLHQVLDPTESGTSSLQWLKAEFSSLNQEYYESMQKWIEFLDRVPLTDSYL